MVAVIRERMVAPCGLDCYWCAVRRATGNKQVAEELVPLLSRPANEIHCLGCRVDRSNCFAPECETYDCCVRQKGLDFCYQCPDFPCARLAPFINSLPFQNIKLYNLVRIQKVGLSRWLKEEARLAYRRYFKGQAPLRVGGEPVIEEEANYP